MMSAKGQVMYYSNASNTGEVPTGDCISMNSKKGELGGVGGVEDNGVARSEEGRKEERKEEKNLKCFHPSDTHHSIIIHTIQGVYNYGFLS